jgi:hypothetical protein
MSLEAVILALASAVRPSTSLAAVYDLMGAKRPRPLLLAFVAGGALFSVAVGVLVVVALDGVELPGGDSTFVDVVDVVAGVAALGFASGVRSGRAARRFRNRRPREEPSRVERMLREPSPWVAAAVGAATHVPGLFYLVALNSIAATRSGLGEATVAVLVYNVIWFAVPIAACVAAKRRPVEAHDLIDHVNDWVREHEEAILALLFAAVGAYLLCKGVAGLVR